MPSSGEERKGKAMGESAAVNDDIAMKIARNAFIKAASDNLLHQRLDSDGLKQAFAAETQDHAALQAVKEARLAVNRRCVGRIDRKREKKLTFPLQFCSYASPYSLHPVPLSKPKLGMQSCMALSDTKSDRHLQQDS